MTLTFSRLEKPLYSTRIIKGDCNPVFEETAVLLVDVNTVKLRERISFQLWDSDRMSVVSPDSPLLVNPHTRADTSQDDMMGFAEIDVVDLIRQRGQAMGAEFKGKGAHVSLGPMMNKGRIAQGRRNWEGFGAAPFLSGESAYETIIGMQESGAQACAKHYINK